MSGQPQTADAPAGIAAAALAYVIWGILPIYWHGLAAIPALELTCWRVVLSALVVLALMVARGRLAHLRQVLTSPRRLGWLAVSAALIGGNWWLYVYSVESHQLVEASMGYFILPLISIALGVLFLGERLSRFRLAALVLMAAAVAVQAIALGKVPWIALVLALSFGLYGYVRKQLAVGAFEGLFVETGLLFPFALAALIWWGQQGDWAFSAALPGRDVLLLGAGPVTALPLALFGFGTSHIRLSTLGFLQYLSPSITLVVAVVLFTEPFSRLNAASFGAVWLALALVAAERPLRRRLALIAQGPGAGS